MVNCRSNLYSLCHLGFSRKIGLWIIDFERQLFCSLFKDFLFSHRRSVQLTFVRNLFVWTSSITNSVCSCSRSNTIFWSSGVYQCFINIDGTIHTLLGNTLFISFFFHFTMEWPSSMVCASSLSFLDPCHFGFASRDGGFWYSVYLALSP